MLLLLCTSWSVWELCWPLYAGEGFDEGISMSEDVVASCGAWVYVVSVQIRQGKYSLWISLGKWLQELTTH